MKEDWSSRQEYYQQIARTFLRHQTSMFFLPPRDLALIAEWEKLNIPLEAIIEGIERTFARQLSRKRKRNIFSLSLCEKEILRAYAQYQERLVGQNAPHFDRSEKIEKVKSEIKSFLENLPANFRPLQEYYERALAALNENQPDESLLEQLDEDIDQAIWQLSSEQEKNLFLEEAKKDFPDKGKKQLAEIQRILLIKNKRQAHRIPYVSLFYY